MKRPLHKKNMAKRISEQGNAPGERTDRAGLCKAHKARLCELERNPRQPTANPLSHAEINKKQLVEARSPSHKPKTKNIS